MKLHLLWIFCPFEHCVLRNHADIIHLAIINMVTDYTQYEVWSMQCSNGQKIHSILDSFVRAGISRV